MPVNPIVSSGLLALCAFAASPSLAAASDSEPIRRLRRGSSRPERREQTHDMDFFLMSGQSNMCGHTTSPASITSDGSYWAQIKAILDAGGDLKAMEGALFDAIKAANSRVTYGDVVATTLTNETMKLYNAGLLDDLDVPLSLGSCSYVDPDRERDRSGGTKPTVWSAYCGESFGHELTFSRALELKMGQQRPFEAVKNAHGGTEIHRDWYPGHGKYWESLRSSIRSRKGHGDWKGFIWHQGTQESWTDEDTSLTYLGNLTGLVQEVRKEMFDASHAGTWECPEAIPVVIVQIGRWPEKLRAQNVRNAQTEFCDGDQRAQIVYMSDTSPFYHFDAPSFLIGGHRIAQAYHKAAQTSFVCPSSEPSSQPSTSSKPSNQPTTSAQPSSSAKPSSSTRPSTLPSVRQFPSVRPSSIPSRWPSPEPSPYPTTYAPTYAPTAYPTYSPTAAPTAEASMRPSGSGQPSIQPSTSPPSNQPSPFIMAGDDFVSMSTAQDDITLAVLQNDKPGSGPHGFGLILTSIDTQAANGECTIVHSLEGLLMYEPNFRFVGTDSCIYEVCDLSSRCSLATVTITISSVSSVTWEDI